jgi:hypothetical protein
LAITCGPNSNAKVPQVARQPPTVKLARVLRATVGGSDDLNARKADKFIALLAGSSLSRSKSLIKRKLHPPDDMNRARVFVLRVD